MRMIECRHCNVRTHAKYLQGHEEQECGDRPVECRKGCGFKGLKAKDQEEHEKKICTLREDHLMTCAYGCVLTRNLTLNIT